MPIPYTFPPSFYGPHTATVAVGKACSEADREALHAARRLYHFAHELADIVE